MEILDRRVGGPKYAVQHDITQSLGATTLPRERENMPKLFLSVREAHESLGIGRTKLTELIRDGTLQSQKIGTRRLVSLASVQLLAGCKFDATTPTHTSNSLATQSAAALVPDDLLALPTK